MLLHLGQVVPCCGNLRAGVARTLNGWHGPRTVACARRVGPFGGTVALLASPGLGRRLSENATAFEELRLEQESHLRSVDCSVEFH